MKTSITFITLTLLLSAGVTLQSHAQGTAFTYHGQLNLSGSPANGYYDMVFHLTDVAAGGLPIATNSINLISVSNGLFTVMLDYGVGKFPGTDRWLNIAVRTNGPGIYTGLSPRQKITAVPYAITAGDLTGTLPAAQVSGALSTAQLPANVALLDAVQTFIANQSFGAGAQVFASSGSAAAPGLAFNGDANTGVFNPLGNTLGFSTFGAERMRINSNGRVGISSTNPVTELDVRSTATNSAGQILAANSNADTWVMLWSGHSDAGNEPALIWSDPTVGDSLRFMTGDTDGSPAVEWMRIRGSDGFVGMGMNNPQGKLHVAGNVIATRFAGDGSLLTNINLNGLTGTDFWRLDGNVNTTPGTHFLGTTDDKALELKANNTRALRLEPNIYLAPNVIGGAPINYVRPGVFGATIGGGGAADFIIYDESGEIHLAFSNSIASDFGTIGGGVKNTIQPNGGSAWFNAPTIGGGFDNTIETAAYLSTIAGGSHNQIRTNAAYSTIGGGISNEILTDADFATIPGGSENKVAGDYGFAAGRRARANHNGTFVWADSTDANFTSTGNNQFLIRASGGVGIGTTSPSFDLEVSGTAGKPGGGLWSSSSDARLKKNIRPLTGVLDKLLALRGVNFEFIDPEEVHELSGERMGLIAQEVEQVFPDWVETGPNGYKRVTVRGLEALVVEGLRELRAEKQSEIESLKQRLEKLERATEQKHGGTK